MAITSFINISAKYNFSFSFHFFSSLQRQEWLFILLPSKQNIMTKKIIDPALTIANRIACYRVVNNSQENTQLFGNERTFYIWPGKNYFSCT